MSRRRVRRWLGVAVCLSGALAAAAFSARAQTAEAAPQAADSRAGQDGAPQDAALQTSAPQASGSQANASQAKTAEAYAAEADQILASYEGQNVVSVGIAGQPQLSSAQFASLFTLRAGEPFSLDKAKQSAAALKAGGHFEQVRIEVDPEPNGVRVLFVLEPAVYFGIFEFPGAARFPYSQLVQESNYPVQTPFNQDDVDQGQQGLLTFFRQEGYFQAEVQAEPQFDNAHGIANVVFHATLGRRAKFAPVDLEGAPDGDSAQLEHSLTTLSARLRGAAIRPGKDYHHSAVLKAQRYLQSQLAARGFLSAQVKIEGAEYIATSNKAEIHFTVTPGARTHVEITGAHLWSWTRRSLLPAYQGVGVDQESVEEGRQALISYFEGKGYFDVDVDAQLENAASGETLTYTITRKKKHKVTAVTLAGNAHVPDARLKPGITVQQKRWFSPGKYSDQLVRTSVNNLKSVYVSAGYSSVEVAPRVVRQAGNVQISFRVTEGPRDTVNSLTIDGADTFPQAQFAPNGLKIAVGQPYSQARVQADRAGIVAHYLQAGYLNASFRETAAEVSKQEPHRINVVYHITEGPRVITGNVVVLGRLHTRERLIEKDLQAIKPGQPLTESDLLTAGSRLYGHTGVFDWAEVDPRREIRTQTEEDVLAKVHEQKKNEFTYGFGFEVINRGGSIPSGTVALPNLPPLGLPSGFTSDESTFYGPRGTIQYTRNNIGGRGESLSLTAFAGRLDQRAAIDYIDPNFRWSPWTATVSYSEERDEENPIFSSQIEDGGLQFQRTVDHAQKDLFSARYDYSKTDLTRVLIPDLVPARDQHVRLSTLGANLTRDTRDNAVDEHRGVLESLEIDFNSSKLGASVDFAKLTGQAAYYKEKLHHIVWAESLRIGLAHSFAGSFVPLSQEFFSGGGNSLRGFPLDSAGPQRPLRVCPNGGQTCNTFINVPTGGDELLIVNSEARIPLPFKKGLSLVPFYDGGNVFSSVGFRDFIAPADSPGTGYSNNVGLGLRYSTPVGPVRIDVGHDLNPAGGVKATNYFISVGQAF
jgi:outer membrane protein insertion porin family